jgi:hypothetical protein
MAPLNNPRLAWSVALASLALWATSVPLTWGQLSADATRMLDVPVTSTSSSTADDSQQPDDLGTPCPPAPAAAAVPALIATLLPTPPPAPAAAQVPSSSTGTGTSGQGSFHLCGADASAAQAIEQLIAGRSFSASLNTAADGCADLFVRATSPVGSGSATSRLSVSLGNGQNLQIQITSQNGATHVSIASGQ